MRQSGVADELMQQLPPLLAADGIVLNNPSTMNLAPLNEARGRATQLRGFRRHGHKPHLSVDRAVPHH
jgi:hypothetical protein